MVAAFGIGRQLILLLRFGGWSVSDYLVWVPDDGEDESHARIGRGYDTEDMAKNEVDRRYTDDPFSSAMTVYIRCPDGSLVAYEVHPEPSIWFNAYEVDLGDE